MKIFISGIAGFLGSHLADAMLAKGYEVAGCDNLIGGTIDNVPKETEFHTKDILDFEAMKRLLRGVDIVYHTAALAYEGLSVFSPYLISTNIYSGSVSLISAAIANKCEKIYFFSSMARYGKNKVPFREFMVPVPQDPYGISKYSAELVLRMLCDLHGMEYVICVPHNIIGPRQKYDDPYRNVASIMINLMLQERQPIIYGDGQQKRCFSFIKDNIQVLDKLTETDSLNGQVINIGPDEEFITILQLAETIAGILSFKLDPVFMPVRPVEVELATCSADKARKYLGYKTEYTLKQGLTEMIDYIKDKGTKSFKYHLNLEIINEKTPKTWSEHLF